MWLACFSIGGFIVQDPPYVVRLFQHRGFIVQDPPYVVRLFQHRGFIVQDPPHVVRLFQHRWVHCAGPSSYGASILAQVGSLCRTLLMWCVYFSIGGSNYINRERFVFL
jgi:hypothetical protein